MIAPIESLRGIVTVLNTPFKETGEVDTEALRRHVRYACHAGVAGFLVPAKAAEVDRLTEAERYDMVAAVCAEAGDTPVIGGCQAADQATRVAAAHALGERGCAGVLINMPFDGDTETFARDFKAFAATTDRMVMLQDWDASGSGLPVDFIAKLFEDTPNFRALKIEVQPAGPKYSAVLEATKGKLHVSGGWAVMQFIEALDRGVHGFMPTGLHHAYVSIYQRYAAGDREAARKRFEEILPILAVSNQDMELALHFFKRLLWRQGLYPTPDVRPPTYGFDAAQARIADEMIARAITLEDALGGVPQ